MSETVKGIGKVDGIDRQKKTSGRLWVRAGNDPGKPDDEQNDSVDISEEAKSRASGRYRKTILEHLADEKD